MEAHNKKKETVLILGAVLLGLSILVLDLMIPLGIASGVPYVVLVLLGMWSTSRRYILFAAIAGSVLTVIGFFLSPPGGELWVVLSNRFLALFAIWVTAIICLFHKRTENELKRYREHLEELVEQRTQDQSASNQELEKYRNHLEDLVGDRTRELSAAQKRLIHSEKLSATGKLAASIAHEFNNPICGIRNTLERMDEKLPLRASYRDSVQLAIRECNRIANLIKQLNDFHRPSSDIPKTFDIHDAIDEMIALSKKKLKERNVELKKQYSRQIPKIEAIPDQIKQVILNLLQNAEESLPEDGGKIVIITEQVDSQVKVHVKDFGQGIPKDNLDKLFDPFFTTKSDVKGTGLGLSISYGIIKNQGGTLTVESEVGKGSQFTITLPMKSAAR